MSRWAPASSGIAFLADQPASFGANSVQDIATELDAYADWKLNSNFPSASSPPSPNPQDGVGAGAIGRTEDFTYGMIYVAYSY